MQGWRDSREDDCLALGRPGFNSWHPMWVHQTPAGVILGLNAEPEVTLQPCWV